MKKPGLSVGSIVMMLVTAFVVVGMAAFLNLIAGDDVYERTRAVFGNLAEQMAERETAEPTVSPTKTPFFKATAEPTVEPSRRINRPRPSPSPPRARFTRRRPFARARRRAWITMTSRRRSRGFPARWRARISPS